MIGLHLNPLRSKVVGELIFTSESPLHIGAGGEEVRRTFLRLLDGHLFVPASTWKGSMRALAEKIAKTMTFKEPITTLAVRLYRETPKGISYIPSRESPDRKSFDQLVCDIIDSLLGRKPSNLITNPQNVETLLRELGYEEEEIDEVKKGEKKQAEIIAGDYLAIHCPIGALFGNKVLASKLRFTDSILTSRETDSRPGVGIDRKSGRVEESALHFTETTPTSTNIKLRITADNLKPGEDSIIMGATLETIKLIGLQIGARKSAGLGNLTIDTKNSKFYPINLEQDKDGTQLANPFKHIQPLPLEEFIKWLREDGNTYP